MKEVEVMLSKASISLDFSHSHCGYVHCGRTVSYLSQQMKRLNEEAARNSAVARKRHGSAECCGSTLYCTFLTFYSCSCFAFLKRTSCSSNKLVRRSNVFSFSADVKWKDWETLQEVNAFLTWDSFRSGFEAIVWIHTEHSLL